MGYRVVPDLPYPKDRQGIRALVPIGSPNRLTIVRETPEAAPECWHL